MSFFVDNVVSTTKVESTRLHEICLEAGADDVGFVEVGRPEVRQDREDLLRVMPGARSLISFVVRMNREPLRTPARSISNLEFHQVGDRVNEISREIVSRLERMGIAAINPSMGFPMEMDRFPGKIWVISHKKVAEAAGLGHMGIHRNLIHPRFGSFVLLGTIITEAEIVTSGSSRTAYATSLSDNPCLECKLCVAACPVGAIHSDGSFDFSACYTHNYREFMGGFTDWVEQVAGSRDGADYRRRVTDSESSSMWQSLSFGANYKAAYCLAVCPAGEDVISPFLADRKGFLNRNVRPLQDKTEVVYVQPGSDAETHVAKRFPAKTVKRVGNGLRPRTVDQFLSGLRLTFQRGRSRGIDATYHFVFSGRQPAEASVTIRQGKLTVNRGLKGRADLRVRADSETWLGFLAGERSLLMALALGRIRLRGSWRLLPAFARCFPSPSLSR